MDARTGLVPSFVRINAADYQLPSVLNLHPAKVKRLVDLLHSTFEGMWETARLITRSSPAKSRDRPREKSSSVSNY